MTRYKWERIESSLILKDVTRIKASVYPTYILRHTAGDNTIHTPEVCLIYIPPYLTSLTRFPPLNTSPFVVYVVVPFSLNLPLCLPDPGSVGVMFVVVLPLGCCMFLGARVLFPAL